MSCVKVSYFWCIYEALQSLVFNSELQLRMFYVTIHDLFVVAYDGDKHECL